MVSPDEIAQLKWAGLTAPLNFTGETVGWGSGFAKLNAEMVWGLVQNIPQGLKPRHFAGLIGPTKVGPFQDLI
jgi:hypothetical protein